MMAQPGNALAIALALVLISAAIHKLYARDRLVFATSRLLQVHGRMARWALLAAAGGEGAAALMLFMPQTRSVGAALAIGLWSIYFAALAAAVRRGDTGLDCGCSLGARSHGIDRFVLLRPVVLVLLAVAVAVLPQGFDPVAPFAGLAFFAAYVAAGELAGAGRLAR